MKMETAVNCRAELRSWIVASPSLNERTFSRRWCANLGAKPANRSCRNWPTRSPQRRTTNAPTHNTAHQHDQGERSLAQAVIEGKRPQIRRQEAQRQKHREGSHIEDALHSPDRNLRGEGEALFLGDDVGANHLARASQQRQRCEADELRRQQTQAVVVLRTGFRKMRHRTARST